jgi:hypothetical protein
VLDLNPLQPTYQKKLLQQYERLRRLSEEKSSRAKWQRKMLEMIMKAAGLSDETEKRDTSHRIWLLQNI